ncbi:MAG: leucine--tRNA ligase [Candidatus Pacebacteria bacterium]|nr:leucine--tRNA ligase [Candidatus Paceibacterota bacterium]
MAEKYEPEKIEPKWQKYWDKKGLYKAEDFSDKPKFYLLLEFPYPSGAGLHIGHCRPYTGLDVIARKKRMQGYNVLFPMGWDAFGLPTENYAIKTGIHPAIATRQNTEIFKRQQKRLGFSFDWQREINTTDPKYYKWTQWIFLKLFEQGLAYKARIPINWCLSCKIGLANEEVVDGKCERCGGEIEKREKEQWLIKITKYAERLIDDLDLVDFPERVKIQQKEWIGKSVGWEITFKIKIKEESESDANRDDRYDLHQVDVFTTRIDTLFGCTYLVMAPEHNIISNLKLQISNWEEIEEYVEKAKKKSELERQADVKEKTGVKIEGISAINPANGKEIPIFVADYVLAGYGTGAIMAVPAHDQRDFEFAKEYNLLVMKVILPPELSSALLNPLDIAMGKKDSVRVEAECWEDEGVLVNSEQFNGLNSVEAMEKIGQWLSNKGLAKKQVNYKLRDWVFSRQRYWGEPIPLVYCEKCSWVAVPEKDLPVVLPDIKDYKPSDSGESPLVKAEDWVNTKCPKCKGKAKRETDVMPNWAGSNWYFMRYCDPHNGKDFADQKLLKYWMIVDWYNGGMEHTTLHLLYSRFIYKFLWDIKEVSQELGPEPYKKRTSHGMVLAEGGVKMSKSKGNVINPDDVVKEYGADTLRVYEMFMGPFEQAIAWDTKGVRGVYRFLQKIYKLNFQFPISNFQTNQKITNPKLEKLLHKTIKKVSEDIEAMKFNTAVSALMILNNEMEKEKEIPKDIFEKFLLILAPFSPHLAEELWWEGGKKESIFLQEWPKYDKNLIQEEVVKLVVQINGKARGVVEVNSNATEQDVLELARKDQKINKWLENKQAKKVVFVKNKLINFVI